MNKSYRNSRVSVGSQSWRSWLVILVVGLIVVIVAVVVIPMVLLNVTLPTVVTGAVEQAGNAFDSFVHWLTVDVPNWFLNAPEAGPQLLNQESPIGQWWNGVTTWWGNWVDSWRWW